MQRVVIEAVQAKYPNVTTSKDIIETGMNDGGVVWIGGIRVAETAANGGGEKVFTIYAEKVKAELKKAGWDINGDHVVVAHRAQ